MDPPGLDPMPQIGGREEAQVKQNAGIPPSASFESWLKARRAREGQGLASVVRHLEITEPIWHRWRDKYGMKPNDAKSLKELEKESHRWKKIVADQALDIEILKEG
jgi:hypothetical protein